MELYQESQDDDGESEIRTNKNVSIQQSIASKPKRFVDMNNQSLESNESICAIHGHLHKHNRPSRPNQSMFKSPKVGYKKQVQKNHRPISSQRSTPTSNQVEDDTDVDDDDQFNSLIQDSSSRLNQRVYSRANDNNVGRTLTYSQKLQQQQQKQLHQVDRTTHAKYQCPKHHSKLVSSSPLSNNNKQSLSNHNIINNNYRQQTHMMKITGNMTHVPISEPINSKLEESPNSCFSPSSLDQDHDLRRPLAKRRQQRPKIIHNEASDINGSRIPMTTTSSISRANTLKFVSQIYFLIHLSVILCLLLHHRIMFIQQQKFAASHQDHHHDETNGNNNIAPNVSHPSGNIYKIIKRDVDEPGASVEKLINDTTKSGFNKYGQSPITSTFNNHNIIFSTNGPIPAGESLISGNDDMLIRVFGYSHASRFLYYALAYLLTSSAIILILLRIIRYFSRHHPTEKLSSKVDDQQEAHYYQYYYDSIPLIRSKSNFYQRTRLDCSPVLIGCIGLGLAKLANIGLEVASKIDIMANQSRWPVYLAALHFSFVSLMTQYILGWVTMKHEQKRLFRAFQSRMEAASKNNLMSVPFNQSDVGVIGTRISVSIPSQSNLLVQQQHNPSHQHLNRPLCQVHSINNNNNNHNEITTTKRVENNQENMIDAPTNRIHCPVISPQSSPLLEPPQSIGKGLNNIALAHILVTHLLIWLMDLNSIQIFETKAFSQAQSQSSSKLAIPININNTSQHHQQEASNNKLIYTAINNHQHSPGLAISRTFKLSPASDMESSRVHSGPGSPLAPSIRDQLELIRDSNAPLNSTHKLNNTVATPYDLTRTQFHETVPVAITDSITTSTSTTSTSTTSTTSSTSTTTTTSTSTTTTTPAPPQSGEPKSEEMPQQEEEDPKSSLSSARAHSTASTKIQSTIPMVFSHRLDKRLNPTKPPNPIKLDESNDNYNRLETSQELGDPGSLSEPSNLDNNDQTLAPDLRSVLPSRKRRLPNLTPKESSNSSLIKNLNSVQKPPDPPRSQYRSSLVAKRKTAFKPVMQSRHINLTIPPKPDPTPPYRLDPNSHLQSHSTTRSNGTGASSSINKTELKQQKSATGNTLERVIRLGERPFPSLETNEPVAWPTTGSTSSVTQPSRRHNQQIESIKEYSNPAKKQDTVNKLVPAPSFTDETTKKGRRNQQDSNAINVASADGTDDTTHQNGKPLFQEATDESSRDPEDEEQQQETDELDSQLPPVPNYDNTNNNDYPQAPTTTTDNQNSTNDSEPEGGEPIPESEENEEYLQQLNHLSRGDSRRLSPISQALVSPDPQIVEAEMMTAALNDSFTLKRSFWPTKPIQDVDDQWSSGQASPPSGSVADYLHTIVGQYHILLAAILLNLWLDGLFAMKRNTNTSFTSLVLGTRCVRSSAAAVCNPKHQERRPKKGSPPSVSSGSEHCHLKSMPESSWSPASSLESLETNQSAVSFSSMGHRLLHGGRRIPYCGSRQAPSSSSRQLTACSLFAGLVVAAASLTAIIVGIELVTIITQCLTQLCTILACLLGLILIWRSRRRLEGSFSTRLSPTRRHGHLGRLRQKYPRNRGLVAGNARVWQQKSSVYLEATTDSRPPFNELNKDSNYSRELAKLNQQSLGESGRRKSSGRQCFHYLFLLAAYYWGASIALNLGAQYSMQALFPQPVIQFITSQQLTSSGPLPPGPILISHLSILFHSIIAIKGFLLITQVTIQTILIRSSCDGQASDRLNHVYTFLMFANLSLWAMEISSNASAGAAMRLSTVIETADSVSSANQLEHHKNHHQTTKSAASGWLVEATGYHQLMSMETFIGFASSVVTLSHLYHGLIFM